MTRVNNSGKIRICGAVVRGRFIMLKLWNYFLLHRSSIDRAADLRGYS
jgi:hypothetical protein